VLARYVLFQLPGWSLAILAGAAAVHWWDLAPTIAAVFVVLWILKDFVLFPFLRIAYDPQDASASSGLEGSLAVAEGPLEPSGYVRVGAELWRAELGGTSDRAPAGAALRVRAVRGLTLLVEPEAGEEVPSSR
jgi:membrane protein implicated in regulation of membrane protease activity